MSHEREKPRVVAKFGGTSVLHPYMVQQAMREDEPVVTVLSAVGRTERDSSKLTGLLREYEQEPSRMLLERMVGKLALVSSHHTRANLHGLVLSMMYDIDQYRSNEWPLEALGELWTTQRYASRTGATMLDPRKLVIVGADGRLLVDDSVEAIRERVNPDHHVLVPGFFGADRDGNVRTLELGGSDITGALFALALRAAEYHNWTDRDGCYDRDPQLHADAVLLENPTYEEIIEAKHQVFHPTAAELLNGTATETILRNTTRNGYSGTTITTYPNRRVA